MDVRFILGTVFGLQSVIAKPIAIGQQEKNNIIGLINNARRNVEPPAASMTIVTWDNILEDALKNFTAQINPSWFYQQSTKYVNTVDYKADYNLMFLMKEPQFKSFDKQGYHYMWHDTCNKKAGDVRKIFVYRIKQQNCLDYEKCDAHNFSNYQSCSAMPIIRESGLRCSWAWRYYSMLVRDDLRTIACMRLGIPGPSTPNAQKDSFPCYGKIPQTINDVPYMAGPTGSKCPPDYPKLKNNLCTQ